MLSSSIPTRRAIWNQRINPSSVPVISKTSSITGFWVFETRENQRTIIGFGYFKNFKDQN
jgi:hypothetical protein